MRARLARLGAVGASGMFLAAIIIACSDSGRPPVGGTSSGVLPETDGNFLDVIDAGDGSDVDLSYCRNTNKDGDETDVDCGGSCGGCALGKTCAVDKDCADEGAKCTNKVCAKCSDGKTDGDETDVDCGGKACGPCGVGKQCKVGPDCKSEACTANACACPPNMTIVARATGGAYCVDSSEVTKGQYNKFITANVPVGTQIPACSTNTTFIPRGAWPPAVSPGPLEFNLGLPVHYVDWCDAYAYCKWAKKELCGTVNGGPIGAADTNDATKDAWYNACTAQGTKGWPYDVAFDDTKCNGIGRPGTQVEGPITATSRGFGYATNSDDNVYQVATSDIAGNITDYVNKACQGGSVGLYQMSGNVAEWEDSCDSTAANANCRLRGGSYAAGDVSTDLACNANRTMQRIPAMDPGGAAQLKDVGIRCCLY
ncbi:MAG: SUMF1/EgtB/PvdO family nonheme iron enzyme [Deltaproteobacteria bacterium]|nr:SUMF1/EgtB/PvdO family nonheme iron enzyme [Deltaproteobacteria bacterium]